MAARGERCRLCSKLVAAKERRVLKGKSSAPGEVLNCLLALSLSSGGTGGAADLNPSDSPQCFLCKRASQRSRGTFDRRNIIHCVVSIRVHVR